MKLQEDFLEIKFKNPKIIEYYQAKVRGNKLILGLANQKSAKVIKIDGDKFIEWLKDKKKINKGVIIEVKNE